MSRRSAILLGVLTLVASPPAQAQSDNGSSPGLSSDPRGPAAGAEAEIARSEQELASRLVELRKAQEAEDRHDRTVSALANDLETARQSGDPTLLSAAEAALRNAEQLSQRLAEQTATAQKLHVQAKDKVDIARRKHELASAKSEPANRNEKSKTPFEDALKRRTQVEHAAEEAELAQKQTRTLQEHLQTLLRRQQELRGISDELGRKLNAVGEGSAADRQAMWKERQEYVEAVRRITDEIQTVREEILLAEATQRIKEDAADEAKTAYERWKTSLIMTAFLLGAALLLVLIARVVLARVIREPEQRYTLNKAFSLATTLIVVFGMFFIFADQFSSLLTLLGFAVAGLAIALQEIVSSLAAWFLIRGNRGYTTRDWVQIGAEFGEVVDITFLRTTIQQFEPLNADGKSAGANPTGGLIVLMNNAVFKSPLINYTRGYPYVWCSLSYNFTFESNWDRACDILQQAMLSERETIEAARRAKKNIAEMASSFHIDVPSTQPVVRTSVSNVGVELTLRFLAHPRLRPELLDRVNLRVLRAIQQTDDIRFAYWTVRSIATPTKDSTDMDNASESPRIDEARRPAAPPTDSRHSRGRLSPGRKRKPA